MIEVGSVIGGRYRLGALMARGGMGDVHEAVDRETGESVVVKVLRGTQPGHVGRFASESLALERLEHPAIVALRDRGEHEGIPYLVMERIAGPSLRRAIADGPLPADDVARIGRDLADALAYAHGRGIVHRDVKPANVLLAPGRATAHLADFGIARLADVTGLTATGVTVGTAAYLAPEQLHAGGVGPAADMYSLGLVLLEALTGEPAFDGTTTASALARLHRDPAVPDGLPTGWRHLLRAMTRRDPSARPVMEEVVEALRDGAPEPDVPARSDPTRELPTELVATLVAPSGAGASAGPWPIRSVVSSVAGGARIGRRHLRPAVALAAVALAGLLVLTVGGPWSGAGPARDPVAEETVPEEVVAEDEGTGDEEEGGGTADEDPGGADTDGDADGVRGGPPDGRGRGGGPPPGRGPGR